MRAKLVLRDETQDPGRVIAWIGNAHRAQQLLFDAHRRAGVVEAVYANPSEVVRAPLLLLAERDRLRKAVAEGLAQARRGELVDGAKVVADVRASLRARNRPN